MICLQTNANVLLKIVGETSANGHASPITRAPLSSGQNVSHRERMGFRGFAVHIYRVGVRTILYYIILLYLSCLSERTIFCYNIILLYCIVYGMIRLRKSATILLYTYMAYYACII